MTYDEAVLKSPIVHAARRAGISAEDLVGLLVEENERLIGRLALLDSIAPFAFLLNDGTRIVWRCPDELIPVRKLEAPNATP